MLQQADPKTRRHRQSIFIYMMAGHRRREKARDTCICRKAHGSRLRSKQSKTKSTQVCVRAKRCRQVVAGTGRMGWEQDRKHAHHHPLGIRWQPVAFPLPEWEWGISLGCGVGPVWWWGGSFPQMSSPSLPSIYGQTGRWHCTPPLPSLPGNGAPSLVGGHYPLPFLPQWIIHNGIGIYYIIVYCIGKLPIEFSPPSLSFPSSWAWLSSSPHATLFGVFLSAHAAPAVSPGSGWP